MILGVSNYMHPINWGSKNRKDQAFGRKLFVLQNFSNYIVCVKVGWRNQMSPLLRSFHCQFRFTYASKNDSLLLKRERESVRLQRRSKSYTKMTQVCLWDKITPGLIYFLVWFYEPAENTLQGIPSFVAIRFFKCVPFLPPPPRMLCLPSYRTLVFA